MMALRAYLSMEPPPGLCQLLSWLPAPLLSDSGWSKQWTSVTHAHMWHPFKGHADFAAALLKGLEQVDLWVSHPINLLPGPAVWQLSGWGQKSSGNRVIHLRWGGLLANFTCSIFSSGNKRKGRGYSSRHFALLLKVISLPYQERFLHGAALRVLWCS